MINLPSSVLTLMDKGELSIVGLVLFQFGTGTYGFAKSDVPITYDGITYQPGGVIQISELQAASGLVAQQFTITLAASPDDGLTPAVLQTIEAEDYRDRPVTVFDVFLHPDTGQILHVQIMKRGYVDVIDHEDNASEGYTLSASCETRALDYTRTNARKRTVSDQNRRSPGDKFHEHAAQRGRQEYFWGKNRSSQTSTSSMIIQQIQSARNN